MRRVIIYSCLIGGGLVVLGCMGLVVPIEILATLALGWIWFLGRVLPEVTVAWGSVAVALICVAGIAVLGHGFGGWLVGQIAPGRRWRARWTTGAIAGVVVLFTAGIGAAGAAHQVGWLLTAGEPWVGSSSKFALRVQSVNNLKQIGRALYNYDLEHGSLPPAATLDAEGRLTAGWQARILPFAEHALESKALNPALPWDDPANAAAIRARISIYENPGVRGRTPPTEPAPSHYAGNAWVLGRTRAWTRAEVTDGTSNTVLAGEAAGDFRPWADPQNWRDLRLGVNRSPRGFGSPYPGWANFLFADGSVRFFQKY